LFSDAALASVESSSTRHQFSAADPSAVFAMSDNADRTIVSSSLSDTALLTGDCAGDVDAFDAG